MTPRRALACGLTAAALVLASCAGGDDERGAGEPPTPPDAYSQIVEQIAREGSTPELALQAFTLAFGDLPGVEAPETSDGPGLISGTGAAGIVMEHFDEFTPEQQRAIEEKLIPSDGGDGDDGDADAGASTGVAKLASVVAGRVLVQRENRDVPRRQVPDPELTAQAQIWARKIEARLGRRFAKPIYVISGFDSSQPAWALPVFATRPAATVAGEFGFVIARDANRGHDACLISVSNLVTGDPGDLGRGIDEILAHEVIHCLQFEIAGWPALPRWVEEGTASWGGLALAGTLSSRSAYVRDRWGRDWRKYLEERRSLNWRAHDAFGFFVQADGWLEGDLWDRLVEIFEAGDEQAVFDLAAPDDESLARWAPAHARMSELGRDWMLDPPQNFQLPDDVRAQVEEVDLSRELDEDGEATFTAPGWAPTIYEFKMPDPKLEIENITVEVTGFGRMTWPGGAGSGARSFEGNATYLFCLLADSTECSEPPAPSDTLMVGIVNLADAEITISGEGSCTGSHPTAEAAIRTCLVPRYFAANGYTGHCPTGNSAPGQGGYATPEYTVCSERIGSTPGHKPQQRTYSIAAIDATLYLLLESPDLLAPGGAVWRVKETFLVGRDGPRLPSDWPQ